MDNQRFPYITFTRAAKLSGVSRARFLRAFKQSGIRPYNIIGSDMALIHEKDLPKIKKIALSQKRGRPKKKGGGR